MHLTRVLSRALAITVAMWATSADLRADLVSHWTFNGDLEDSVNGNDGTLFPVDIDGLPLRDPVFTDDRDGNAGSALLLNGLDEFVQVAQNTALPLYQHPEFSISIWVQGNGAIPDNLDDRIWSESTTRNRAALYNLGTRNNATPAATGQFDLFVRGDDGVAVRPHAYSTAEPFNDTWHHIALVDRSGAVELWIDGRRDPGVAGFDYVRPVMDLDITTIGGILRLNDDLTSNVCCLFTGAIDDVRVYDHGLSQAEIEAICPPTGCPEDGDTHCDDLLVEGPLDGGPGLYTITALDSVDDSDDPISYTFRRDNGQGVTQTVGPQPANFTQWTIAEGNWTISVTVDDDALCDDVAADSTCSTELAVACPAAGDTHCESLGVDGPDGNAPGAYTLSVVSSDESGDVPSHTFRAQRGAEPALQFGPTPNATATFALTSGTWTLSVSVDDRIDCSDVADDATCSIVIEIVRPEPMLVAHFTLDGHLEDATDNTEAVPFTGVEPLYVEGFDGNEEGAAEFNGFDDLLVVNFAGEATGGLGLYGNEAYTIAMWVRGGPQTDFRVFSEGSTINNAPLFNIGTQSTGVTGQVDLFIRPEAGVAGGLAHTWSGREAFDGANWHHLAWVDQGGEAILYIDGVRDSSNFNYVKPPLPTDTTTIGGILRAAPSHWFTGAIDDVQLYNYALSVAEIEALVPELEGCPEVGDTHCGDFDIAPAADEGVGVWTFTAVDAGDDSADPILYTFTATNADGDYLQAGPSIDPVALFSLSGGDWTITLSVDDEIRCRDVAADARCSRDVTVQVPEPILLSHWKFDEDLLDSQPAMNHGDFFGGDPVFVPDQDGNAEGAIQFDGVDDYVRAQYSEGLPLYNNFAYSVAMWVRGDGTVDNIDDRVWSEGSSTSNTPLFNIGTHFQGTGPQVDIFVRSATGTVVNHRLSAGAAFDGTWHHIAWVDENGDAALYIDGVRDATDFRYTKPALATMNLDITTIGGIFRTAACCLLTGQIDDVRAFNYNLSAEEVLAIYEGDEPKKPVETFVRGDPNSSGVIDLTDGVVILNFLFLGGTMPVCLDSADADDDGVLALTDAIRIFNFLFLGGAAPPVPSPAATNYTAADCGVDPSADGLACAAEAATCS